MTTYDQSDSECIVYVYREGIASAVGHDLAIAVGDFQIEVDEDEASVQAHFSADSLQVRHAMEDGRARPGKLSAKDQEKIERNIRKDVLEAKRHPVIRFRSTEVSRRDGGVHVQGTLSLHGVERDIGFDGQIVDGQSVAKLSIDQPDFGIEPYRALLGALKIKPQVDVELRVPFVPDEG